MLLKKDTIERKPAKTVQEVRDGQDAAYEQHLKKKLESMNEVEFKISDMVRGKCVFAELTDIVQTVKQIKQYAKEYNIRRPNTYRVIQAESRFGLEIPISDVTLKIVLN